jgi:hypothetical protein
MNPTDQTVDVTFPGGAGKPDVRGVLKLQNNNGNTILGFYRDVNQTAARVPPARRQTSQTPEFSYFLCQFSVLEIDPQNRLFITLSSPATSVSFSCNSQEDVKKLTDYLSQKVGIRHSTLNPAIFRLESLDLGESPFVATLLPMTPRRQERATLAPFEKLMDNSGLTPVVVGKENVDRVELFNAAIDGAALFEAYRRIVPRPSGFDENVQGTYADLKAQWSTVSRVQFRNNRELPKLMVAVEDEVKKAAPLFQKFKNPKEVQKIMFDLMVTYSLYNWDGAAYNPSLLGLLFPFVDAYVAQCGSSDENCGSEVFRLFTFFFEGNEFGELKKAQKQPSIRKLLTEVGEKLDKRYPQLLQLLVQKHVFTLDFLRDDVSTWFLNVFSTDGIHRLWISLLSYQASQEIFVSFLIAFLMFGLKEIDDYAPLCFDEFITMFNGVKSRLPLESVLGTAHKIFTAIHS